MGSYYELHGLKYIWNKSRILFDSIFEKIFIHSLGFNILLDVFYLYFNDEYILFKATIPITKLFKNLLVLIISEIISKHEYYTAKVYNIKLFIFLIKYELTTMSLRSFYFEKKRNI